MSLYVDNREDPQEWLDTITALLEDDQYAWASDTLTGIYDTISRTQRVSDGQINAITNITASVARRGPRGPRGRRW